MPSVSSMLSADLQLRGARLLLLELIVGALLFGLAGGLGLHTGDDQGIRAQCFLSLAVALNLLILMVVTMREARLPATRPVKCVEWRHRWVFLLLLLVPVALPVVLVFQGYHRRQDTASTAARERLKPWTP